MKIKVIDLSESALDWAVAKANGWVDFPTDSGGGDRLWFLDAERAPFGRFTPKCTFQPSTNWAQGGAIIHREKIRLDPPAHHGEESEWKAQLRCEYAIATGETPLIAAMRAYVIGKLGEEVDVSEGLL